MPPCCRPRKIKGQETHMYLHSQATSPIIRREESGKGGGSKRSRISRKSQLKKQRSNQPPLSQQFMTKNSVNWTLPEATQNITKYHSSISQ
uniref:Uncharacterized protein n=1 Tax=Arundo donax TaxID=35708 RepID=A0A0A8XQ52_ARUDO